jgi:hypothetical protein
MGFEGNLYLPKRKSNFDFFCKSLLVFEKMKAGRPSARSTSTHELSTREDIWTTSKQGTLKSAAK